MSLLRLFTGVHYTLTSPLSVTEATQQLAQHVEPWKLARLYVSVGVAAWTPKHLKFEGEISESTFRIRRIPDYKALIVPFEIGAIEFSTAGGTSIRLHAKAPGGAQVFVAACLVGAVVAFARSPDISSFAACAGLALISCAVTTALFDFEVGKARQALAEVFGPPESEAD